MRDVREKVSASSGDAVNVPVVVLANKCDMTPASTEEQLMHSHTIDQFCKQHNIDAWFLTSAKEDINIGEHCQLSYLHIKVVFFWLSIVNCHIYM